MPAQLSDANRRHAHAAAKADHGVKQGDLYVRAEDGTRWGPVACMGHRLHPSREVTRITKDGDGRIHSWKEPDVHQTGQEQADEETDKGYPGYQPDCDLCADQVWDTIDHLVRVEMELRRAG